MLVCDSVLTYKCMENGPRYLIRILSDGLVRAGGSCHIQEEW